MIYEDNRQLIKDGDPLFFKGKALHSKAIQRWSRSIYSHVGIAHWIGTGRIRRLCVIEALEGRGIRVFPVSVYLNRGEDIDWFAITDLTIDRREVVGWAIDKWGKRYASPRQFFRSFITVPLANWLGIATRSRHKVEHTDAAGIKTITNVDRWFCSAFTAEALVTGGWNPPADDNIDPALAAPGAVALFSCLQRKGSLLLRKDSKEG